MLRFAVIGAGGWGWCHVQNLFKQERVTPVAFVDTNSSVFEQLQREYGVVPEQCFTTVDDALNAVSFDAATVSVPNPQRTPMVEKLLSQHIHCLIDKPATHTAEDLRRLLKAGSHSKGMVMVAQNFRLLHAARKVEELINSDCAGPVRQLSLYFCRDEPSRAEKYYGKLEGSTLIAVELGVHHLDLFHYFIGSDPLTIYGRTWRKSDDAYKGDCHLSALLTYPGEVTVSYHSTLMGGANLTNWPGRFEIECERAHIIWDENAPERIRIYQLKCDGTPSEQFESHNPPRYPDDSLARCLDALISAVEGRIPEEAKPLLLDENAHRVLTGLAIAESSKTGEIIDFPEFWRKELEGNARL